MKKTIKGATMTVKNGYVHFSSQFGREFKRGASDYNGLGEHNILEDVYYSAPNNDVGHELVAKFEAWLQEKPDPQYLSALDMWI